MLEDFPDHFAVFDKTDDLHFPRAFGTYQGIGFINFPDQTRPAPPESFFTSLRFQDTGYGLIRARLFPFPPRNVAVKAIVPDHLLTLVRYVGAHGAQPFQRWKDLCFLSVLRRIDV